MRNELADEIFSQLSKQLKSVKHLNAMFSRDQSYLVKSNHTSRTYKSAAFTQRTVRKAVKLALQKLELNLGS